MIRGDETEAETKDYEMSEYLDAAVERVLAIFQAAIHHFLATERGFDQIEELFVVFEDWSWSFEDVHEDFKEKSECLLLQSNAE